MAGKKDAQKTVSFRLNTSKQDELELYEAITNHNRDNADDPYGSSGAYIKAALKNYYDNEQKIQQQDYFKAEMQLYLQAQADAQRELFLLALGEHDKHMVAMVAEAVAGAMKGMNGVIDIGANMSRMMTDGEDVQKKGAGDVADMQAASYPSVQVEQSGKVNGLAQEMSQDSITDALPDEAFFYLQNL